MREPLTSQNWFPKVCATLIAGGGVSMGCVGITGLLVHTDGNPRALGGQMLMWLAVILWCTLLSTSFLFRSGKQAWLSLAAGNVGVWGIYFLLRALIA